MNTSKSSKVIVLEVVAPDEFPRVVGDNTLIFDRRGIKEAKYDKRRGPAFFNIFGGPKRVTRPEPKNHSIFPIITKIGVSVFPAIGTNKLSLAISQSFSLEPIRYTHEIGWIIHRCTFSLSQF